MTILDDFEIFTGFLCFFCIFFCIFWSFRERKFYFLFIFFGGVGIFCRFFLRFFFNFSNFWIFWPFLTIYVLGFSWFSWFFLYLYIYIFYGLFIFFLKLLRLLLKVTKVTTGHKKWAKIGQSRIIEQCWKIQVKPSPSSEILTFCKKIDF